MSKIAFLLFGSALVVLLALASDISGHRIDDDLEFAASEKHRKYEKGDESEHHASNHEEKGGKDEEGHESEHGYVAQCTHTHTHNEFANILFCQLEY